jgi:hypothetical protein
MSHFTTKYNNNLAFGAIMEKKLPPAFQMVEDELKGNPAVGLLREQVIIGMLVAFLGEGIVKVVKSGVNPDIDCVVDSEPLSIKTVSLSGGIRLKWTSNEVKAKEFMKNYRPTSNLLIVRVSWGETGSIRFIPLDSQKSTFDKIGVERYLDYRGTTNTRGVNLSPEAEDALNRNIQTVSLSVTWQKSSVVVNPIDKWTKYWKEN